MQLTEDAGEIATGPSRHYLSDLEERSEVAEKPMLELFHNCQRPPLGRLVVTSNERACYGHASYWSLRSCSCHGKPRITIGAVPTVMVLRVLRRGPWQRIFPVPL